MSQSLPTTTDTKGHTAEDALTLLIPTLNDTGPANGEESPLTALEGRQRLLAHHVRMVARGLTNGLFVYGAVGGLGKSKVIHETLRDEAADTVLLNSHVTPLALYETLFYYRKDRVIWLDDCDGLYGDLKILGLLRSALWGPEGKRIVTYTSSQLGELPSSFAFESRLILTANVLPRRNDAFLAVLGRIDVFELSATDEEVVALMRTIAARGFDDLSPEECLEVVDYIERHGGGRRLSLRLLEPSFCKVQYARAEGLAWGPLVENQLHSPGRRPLATASIDRKADDVRVLLQAREQFPESVGDQQAYWSKATGRSRASFFRVVARYRDAGEK